jgi:hypothetical protein
MMFQHLDKSLAHDARGTENSDRKFLGHILINKVINDFILAKFLPGMSPLIPCQSND